MILKCANSVSRDIGLLLSQEQSLKLAEIYNAASQSAKSFMQEVIRDIDPSALDKISKGAQKQLQLVH